MMRSSRRLAASLLLVAACKFPYPADVADDDAEPDARVACEASTIVCDDARGEYVACSASGTVDVLMRCPLGCAPDEEKCLDIDPHNGLAMYLDMVPDPPDLILDRPAIIDTDTGAILNGAVGVTVPTFLHPYGDGGSIRVFVVGRLSVLASLDVPAGDSSWSQAIRAAAEVNIMGPISIDADRDKPGPGGAGAQGHPGPQGGLGCEGGEVHGSSTAEPGGGGAGGATPGGKGAATGQGDETPGGLARVSTEPLYGGCSGGSSAFSSPGAGGGALQISSRVRIRIADQGQIDASGGGALAGPIRSAGAGVGAGGVILLEAPQVLLEGPNVVLSTKGGGGAGGGEATRAGDGADGGTDATPALGGSAPALAAGGRGGMDTGPQNGFYSQLVPGNGGGGGGAAGRTIASTTVGVIAPQNGAAIRGPLTTERIRTRRVP